MGLLVELGTQVGSIPATVGHQADALGLTVVALAERIRFVDVTEQVHRRIVADQYEEVQFARPTHETFTTMNIARASPRDIVIKASEILAAPIVSGGSGPARVGVFAQPARSSSTLLDGWADRSRRNASLSGSGWLAIPVGADTQQWGRLLLPGSVVNVNRPGWY